jgi:cytolysin (calcineurin-like family phosphatase)
LYLALAERRVGARRVPDKNGEVDPAIFSAASGMQLSAHLCGYATSAIRHVREVAWLASFGLYCRGAALIRQL